MSRLTMKFKVGDKVYIKPWDIKAVIYSIDDGGSILPYFIEDEDGQTSFWPEESLELINE
ncbi:hypothetical protein [Providencia sp. PROV169]|uniref:hypothetical protein n=1 Tax=Providencia sp. PROV169 TaxID=2949875 RepID=UPI00234A212F|nr:hypothetical protein [Providencia sp. PROV169]